jgi:hypothetical protein
VGEFAVTDKGAKQDGGHEWVVTITVENKTPVRILFQSGMDISFSLAEFRAVSSDDPTVGLMVNDASYGEGKVTHVEFQYVLLHDCTVFLDKAKGIATHPSKCGCGYWIRTRRPCDALSHLYFLAKISLFEPSLVDPEWNLVFHPWFQRACNGQFCVPPGMRSVLVDTSNRSVSTGMFTVPLDAMTGAVQQLRNGSSRGTSATTRRYLVLQDAVKEVMPFAEDSDQSAALFILALRAYAEHVTSTCASLGTITVEDIEYPSYAASGIPDASVPKIAPKRAITALPNADGQGGPKFGKSSDVVEKRKRGQCKKCEKLGVLPSMTPLTDPSDPVLNHCRSTYCLFKNVDKKPPDNGTVTVSFAAKLPAGWRRETKVEATFPKGRTMMFEVPLGRYPNAAPGDMFRVVGLDWVFSEKVLEQSGYFAPHGLPNPPNHAAAGSQPSSES